MKVPLSWLKQFLPLTQTVDEIALHLTNLGIEVEDILGKETTFSGIVVGKVISAHQHPNADRLRVARVTDGSLEYQVVCGAPNCREGIIVAFAREGAELLDDSGKKWKIKKSKIRDVESFGMLCTMKELHLAEESDGLIEMDATTPLGIDVASILMDPIFDLSFTPNIGHAQSVLGIARELAASLQLKLDIPKPDLIDNGSEKMSITLENPVASPRFACRIMTDVKVAPSPAWMQNRLIQCGLRPINNVVDVSNYVMLELGHPLHIFDRDKITGSQIVVKKAESPQKFETLDKIVREVPPETLLVCDEKKPLAIAGIMGGLDSSSTEKTHNILIEAAVFAPTSIRKASRMIGLKTDASSRFDRGVDIEGPIRAINRAAELIQQIAGGIVHPFVDAYPVKQKTKKILLRPDRAQKFIGILLSRGEIIGLLERLEMIVETTEEGLVVTIPSYRNDITIEVDLIEEIARLYGFTHIPKVTPVYSTGALQDSPIYRLEVEARSLLVSAGLQECITCDLISPDESRISELPNNATIRVLHPRSIDQSVLRTSLLPGMLKVAELNFNQNAHDLSLFEIGRIHFKEGEKIEEPTCISIFLSGLSRHSHFDRKPSPYDFFDLKGIIENFCQHLHLKKPEFHLSNLHTLHPWRQAEIKIGDVKIGVFGQLHPSLIRGRALFAELNLSDILGLKKQDVKFHPLSLYPSSTRDWTLTLSTQIPYSKIQTLIQSTKTLHLESFEMIDSFSSKELGPDRKNLTFRFVYRDRHQTISTETVEEEHRKLIDSVAQKLTNLL